jgi:hypothetical protein
VCHVVHLPRSINLLLVIRIYFLWNFNRNCGSLLLLLKLSNLVYFAVVGSKISEFNSVNTNYSSRTIFTIAAVHILRFVSWSFTVYYPDLQMHNIHVHITSILYKAGRSKRLPEDVADTLKCVGGVLTICVCLCVVHLLVWIIKRQCVFEMLWCKW